MNSRGPGSILRHLLGLFYPLRRPRSSLVEFWYVLRQSLFFDLG